MPATIVHCVISITDCIGAGLHGLPISNASNLVLMCLHNTIVAKQTTNEDHRHARYTLLRLFQGVGIALVDPFNEEECQPDDSEEDEDRPEGLPENVRTHLPDLTSSEGVLDLLALRSFSILLLALDSDAYTNAQTREGARAKVLPVSPEVFSQVMAAWSVVHALDEHIAADYEFVSADSAFGDFATAAEVGPARLTIFTFTD